MEWQIVTKSSRSRIRSHQTQTKSSEFQVSFISVPEIISKCKADPEFVSLKSQISPHCIGKITAVGLGNFSSSLYSTSQQALYELLIQDQLGELFDPAYSSEELNYLSSKGYEANIGNFTDETLIERTFFMIHCHYTLYEELLSQDWIEKTKVVIIGNSILSIREKFSKSCAINNAGKFSSTLIETRDLAFSDTHINKNFA